MCRAWSTPPTEFRSGLLRCHWRTVSLKPLPPTEARVLSRRTPIYESEPPMLRDLLAAAVRRHVEPSTGVLLSGGIDSSTVAYFAPELPLFTGYYQGHRYDERRWAAL